MNCYGNKNEKFNSDTSIIRLYLICVFQRQNNETNKRANSHQTHCVSLPLTIQLIF